MIVPMKKVTVIVLFPDAQSAVKDLRKLGVVHVEHLQITPDKGITTLQEEIALVNSAQEVLAHNGPALEKTHQERLNLEDWRTAARHAIDLGKRFEQLEAYARTLRASICEWEKWGDFDPRQFSILSAQGVHAALYQVPVKELQQFPEGYVVETVFISAGFAHCLVVAQEKIELPFKQISLPKQGLSEMQKRLSENTGVMAALKEQIKEQAHFYQPLLGIKKGLEKELELQRAIKGMGQEGSLAYLTGYVPSDALAQLSREARHNQWGMVTEEPSEDDVVPTLLRAPRWVALINPVLRLLEVLPGYHELDVSLLFFIFFSLFFGILIGDAGYGAVYALLTWWLQRKFSHKMKDQSVFFLLYVLSFCAITWGLLVGSFFGQQWCANLGFKPLVPALNDSKTMQAFCFFLGALHLSIAHCWRAILKTPSLTALVDVGWIGVLWSAFFFARMLILGEALPGFVMSLLWGGIALVILFTNPQRNMFKGVGEGLGAVALSLMNNFTDVVSYVRLFAVGLAGLAIADTANLMAGSVNGTGVPAAIARVFILVIGHSLNILLGPVSVLVHGVRLNVLEFSGHASITWSGVAYKPLRED